MSKTKFTPAPWTIQRYHGPDSLPIVQADGKDVAWVRDGVPAEQIEANANLIEQAPALLEVLVAYVQNDDDLEAGLPLETYIDRDERIHALARAVIAKALGEPVPA